MKLWKSENFIRYALIMGLSLAFASPSLSLAAPNISGVSGEVSQGKKLIISGASFGTKSPAKPFLWAPFDGSSQPSPLGTVTAWAGIENMQYTSNEGVGGTGGLKASNSSGTWTARVDASGFSWNDYGQQMYLYRKIKRNFDVGDINWKIWRAWPSSMSYPNVYLSSTVGRFYVEMVGSGSWGSGSILRGTTNKWRTDELIMRAESGAGQTNGYFAAYMDGVLGMSCSNLTLKNANYNDPLVRNYVIHGVKANITLPSDYRYWADDVYLDKTWARVMIGNASTWEASVKKEIQIPTSWSASSISVIVNAKTFSANQTAYLYVVDSSGAVNANGYPITIGTTANGDTSTPPSAPTGLRIALGD